MRIDDSTPDIQDCGFTNFKKDGPGLTFCVMEKMFSSPRPPDIHAYIHTPHDMNYEIAPL